MSTIIEDIWQNDKVNNENWMNLPWEYVIIWEIGIGGGSEFAIFMQWEIVGDKV